MEVGGGLTPCAVLGSVDVRGEASEELGVGAEYCLVKEYTLWGDGILDLSFIRILTSPI